MGGAIISLCAFVLLMILVRCVVVWRNHRLYCKIIHQPTVISYGVVERLIDKGSGICCSNKKCVCKNIYCCELYYLLPNTQDVRKAISYLGFNKNEYVPGDVVVVTYYKEKIYIVGRIMIDEIPNEYRYALYALDEARVERAEQLEKDIMEDEHDILI